MCKFRLYVSFTNAQNSTILDMEAVLGIEETVKNYLVITSADFIPFKNDSNYLAIKKIGSFSGVACEILTQNNKRTLLARLEKINLKYDEIEIIVPHFYNIMANYIVNNSSIIF